jgi:uncharacterized protein YdiU (UPF0061 family)
MREYQYDMWRSKLGLTAWNEDTHNNLLIVLKLMDSSAVDYTIFWRELANAANDLLLDNSAENIEKCFSENLARAFYYPDVILNDRKKEQWLEWLKTWSTLLKSQTAVDVDVCFVYSGFLAL